MRFPYNSALNGVAEYFEQQRRITESLSALRSPASHELAAYSSSIAENINAIGSGASQALSSLRAANQSAVLAVQEDLQRIYDGAREASIRSHEVAEAITASQHKLLASERAFSEAVQSVAQGLERAMRDALPNHPHWLRDLVDSPWRNALYAGVSGRPASSFLLPQGFSEELVRSFDEALVELEPENEDEEDPFASFKKLIRDKVSAFQDGEISFSAFASYLNTFVTLVSIVLTLQIIVGDGNSQRFVEKRLDQLQQVERELWAAIEPLRPKVDLSTYYVVRRTVTLRTRATTRSAPIATLYPGQRAKLIRRKGKWIYIEYFDEIEGLPREGWAAKKYLEMQLHKGPSPEAVLDRLSPVIERCPDTKLYVGYIPGVAGAHSQGATVRELKANLYEVLSMLAEDDLPELQLALASASSG